MKRYHKLLMFLMAVLLIAPPIYLMAAETWNETTPASTESPAFGDDRIRELKRAVRERLAQDHEFEASESPAFGSAGSNIGKHKQVTLVEQVTGPFTSADEGKIYAKDVGANTELFMRGPSDGAEIQLTDGNCTMIKQAAVEFLKDLTPSTSDINQLGGKTIGGNASGDPVTTDGAQTLSQKKVSDDLVVGATGPIDVGQLQVVDGTTGRMEVATGQGATRQALSVFQTSQLGHVNSWDYNTSLPLPLVLNTSGGPVGIGKSPSVGVELDVNGKVKASDDIEAIGRFISGGNLHPYRKTINIGDWNMDTTINISVPHGLILSKIIDVTGTVINDSGTSKLQIPAVYANGGTPYIELWVSSIDAVNINLVRASAGIFDNIGYDATGYNRGFLVVDYID